MNAYTAIALAAAALIACATADTPCRAATHSISGESPKMGSATNGLLLTKAQRKTAWKDLHSAAITVTPPARFAVRVRAKVPYSVPMMQMSDKAAHAVTSLKSYDFTMAKGNLLIVSPKSRKIADVISG
jgi:hypothetical protein